jgi:hypothetical protein
MGRLELSYRSPSFPLAIVRLLAMPKLDPIELASAVRARFGREKFVAGVRAALNRLMEAS